MKLVIGVTGEKGSGKNTFIDILTGFIPGNSLYPVSSGDILSDALDLLYVSKTRAHLQRLALIIDAEYGVGTLAEAVRQKILKSNGLVTVFNAVRMPIDVPMITSFKSSILVYITADAKIRYERTKLRKQKVGEDTICFGQFLQEETGDTECHIPHIGAMAHFKLNNNGSLEDFEQSIGQFYRQIAKTFL